MIFLIICFTTTCTSINLKDKVLILQGYIGLPVISCVDNQFPYTFQIMDSIPFKKPRLELSKITVDKGDSDPSEEIIVEHMDIADDERVLHLCEKESEVAKTPRFNIKSSTPDGLIAGKACHNNDIPQQNIDLLFNKYLMASDKKCKNTILVPAQYHQWGLLSKIKERSCTLRELTNVTLKNMSDCKETFIQILEELQIEYTVVELKSLKPKEVQYVFAFDIKSIPKFTFCGYGATKDIAIQVAARNGLEFLFQSC